MNEQTHTNGQAVNLKTEVPANELATIATTALELPEPSIIPFDQKAHDLLQKSIDQVASDWVSELEHVRKNSKIVEQLVMERAAKVKADITQLYLLGSAAVAEAKRGDDVNARLADELDRMAAPT